MSYDPATETTGTFPGLPAGVGLRAVNTFGAQTGQLYVPPQSGVFTVTESVFNNGPEAVTIEAISILSPTDQENIVRGEPAWPLIPAGPRLMRPVVLPLRPAGPVRWRLQTIGSAVKKPWNGNSVVGVSLSPRQGLVLGIPLRMSAACYTQGGWGGLDTFYVKERFLSFTHWAAVKFQPWLIMHEPASPGEPAKDLVCPAGATR